jgi:hypothetical protein
MVSSVQALLLAAGLLGVAGQEPGGSFLYQPAYSTDLALRGPAAPYVPQPGDLFFCTDYSRFWNATHDWAGAGHPHHSGIVVARPDGRLAVLEAGPYYTPRIRVLDIGPHLEKCNAMGETIWVRRRRTPLTCEESERLTAFALRKDGNLFAIIRQGAQLTPLRCRGQWRIYYMGRPHPNRSRYFCSELVTESLVAAGLLDAETARPAATYPSDLFFDHSANRFLNEHLNLSDGWYPPARWTDSPCPELGIEGLEPAAPPP